MTTVRPLRVDDSAEIDAWRLANATTLRVHRPDFEPRSVEEWLTILATPETRWEQHRFVAVSDDGRVIGSAQLSAGLEHDTDKCFLDVLVVPSERGQGVGSVLAQVLRDHPTARARPVWLAHADFSGEFATSPEGRFAAAQGFGATSFESARRLALPSDPDRLPGASQLPPGYEAESWTDGIPEDLQRSFGELLGMVDLDAPSGDIDFDGSAVSPEEYRDELERTLAAGGHQIDTAVLFGGEVVALVQVDVPALPTRPMNIMGTYVRRDHRGNGLGLAAKIANERAIAAAGFPHRWLATGNDDANTWMVAINERLGYEVFCRTAALLHDGER